ncbi:hypothetical protein WYO_0156 [Methylobacterium sp. GXF4]|uniref:hypothetical protein n=1 Tax=Methylobacterium sp. GXF4 TaxID=1096546 RepID=UPI0002698C45|nr:hypothetical protein [Methylobacterium sp. GXF4]EIZ87119.1 hypothetical protein WYO_0156 [Methylobacterium sp. GXF4]
MRITDIPWKRSGMGQAATLYGKGDRVFDLYQDRLDNPLIQVCEFPCIDAQGDARTMTYWVRSTEALAQLLSQNSCSPEQITREAA